MIAPGLLQQLMVSKPRNRQVRIIRPCEPDWCRMSKGVIFEVMAIVAEHCRKRDCKADELCVAAYLADDKLQMVKVYDKVRKPVKGSWRRFAAAFNVLLRGRI